MLHNKNKGISLQAGVFSNFITVLLKFYAQTYSNLIQRYHGKNYAISLYFYYSIKFQLKNWCLGLKKNLNIEWKCIITIGMKGWEGGEQSWTCWKLKWGKILWTLHTWELNENSASLLFHSSAGERLQFLSKK